MDAGAPLDEDWSCLGQDERAPVSTPGVDRVTYVASVLDFGNPALSPPGIDLGICQLADVYCAAPLPVSMTVLASMSMSAFFPRPSAWAIELPLLFEGYINLTAPGYVPAQYFFGGPMVAGAGGEQAVTGEPITMFTENGVPSLFDAVGVVRDPAFGLLLLRTVDCRGQRAPGVQLRLRGAGVPWVLVNGLPILSDPPLATDASGTAGFLNVPPGNLLIEGYVPAGDATYGRTAVRVRPGQITMAEIRPDYGYGR
jgi:hypothetical protein